MDSYKFWQNKNVVITGHTGFKGSWLALLLTFLGANVVGISREKYEGIYKLSSLSSVLEGELFFDINNEENFPEKINNSFKPDILFHFAGQSLVSVGYSNPLDTLNTNIIGTYNVLNYFDKIDSVKSIVVSTTDKVYLKPSEENIETSALGGSDFYSASKASAEFVISSFLNNGSSANVSVVRSGNVLGGGDRANNRLIPDLIKSIIDNQSFTIRQPNSTRPWQYVLDSLFGYLLVAEENYNKSVSEIYNLNSTVNNKYNAGYIAETFTKSWGSDIKIIEESNEKFKEVEVLNLNSQKAKDRLNWIPQLEIDDLLNLIVRWEKSHFEEKNQEFSFDEISSYLKLIK